MAVALATATPFDAARTSPVVSAPVIDMSREDPTLEPYRQEATMSFADFLDIINPLQHIPIISTLYREITGDTIGQPARVMGGFLYGGPLGGMGAVVNVMVEESTGKDIGEQLLSAISGDSGTQTAQRLSSQPLAQPLALNPQAEARQRAEALQQAEQAQAAAQPQPAQTQAPQSPAAPPPVASQAAFAPAGARAGEPVQLAQAPVGPHAAGLATTALMARSNASPLSAERAKELQEQLLNGQYHPSRMPARDATPASTVQAKHAAALAARQWSANGSAVPPSIAAAASANSRAAVAQAHPAAASTVQPGATVQAASAAGPAATPPAAAMSTAAAFPAAGPTPVPPEMMSDVMMRNLAKYEAAKRALNPTTPVIRTSP